MVRPAVVVEGLGKSYQLGLTHSRSIREAVNSTLRWLNINKRGDVLEVEGVMDSSRCRDGVFWALQDVSFEIETGEVVGFIGRNGAGKSTLLKILSRITKPTTGTASLRGRVASLLEVGTGFHPELTGRENVYLNGTILGMTKRDIARQFDSIVDFSGVETHIDTPVKRYSSGMIVRLGFAVAAHLTTELLIVDEVLAVGDAAFQEKCMTKMSDLGVQGRTVLFVSHNMSAIERLTKRCIVIDGGESVFDGPSQAAVDLYLDRQRAGVEAASDVSRVPRVEWAGDRSLEIVSARMIALESGRLVSGSSISFELCVRARQAVSDFAIGTTLTWRDGTPVGSAFSEACGPIRAKETATWRLTMPDPGLTSGRYCLTVGLLRRGHELTDVIHDVLQFDFEASNRIPPGFFDWQEGWGRLRFEIDSQQAEQENHG